MSFPSHCIPARSPCPPPSLAHLICICIGTSDLEETEESDAAKTQEVWGALQCNAREQQEPKPEPKPMPEPEFNLYLTDRHLSELYDQSRSGKLYLPAFEETVTMVTDLLVKCFGTNAIQHRKKTSFSQLAQCEMTIEVPQSLHYPMVNPDPYTCPNPEGCCVENYVGLSGRASRMGQRERREWETVQEG